MRKLLAALAAGVGLLAVFGPSAGASTPPDQPASLISNPAPECINGQWRLHWLLTNSDTAPIKGTLAVGNGPAKSFSPSPIGPSSSGHFFLDVDNGWSSPVTIVISWADGSSPKSGSPPASAPASGCSISTPTLPTVTNPSSQPGTPTTTRPGTKPASTVAPTDPNNPAPSTSVLAQTNGSVIAADPGADASTSTTAGDGSTDTSEAKIALASGADASSPSSPSSGSSGVVWIVVAIFAVAAAGGAIFLLMSRRSAPPGEGPS